MLDGRGVHALESVGDLVPVGQEAVGRQADERHGWDFVEHQAGGVRAQGGERRGIRAQVVPLGAHLVCQINQFGRGLAGDKHALERDVTHPRALPAHVVQVDGGQVGEFRLVPFEKIQHSVCAHFFTPGTQRQHFDVLERRLCQPFGQAHYDGRAAGIIVRPLGIGRGIRLPSSRLSSDAFEPVT